MPSAVLNKRTRQSWAAANTAPSPEKAALEPVRPSLVWPMYHSLTGLPAGIGQRFTGSRFDQEYSTLPSFENAISLAAF